jgi:hypothetical protein
MSVLVSIPPSNLPAPMVASGESARLRFLVSSPPTSATSIHGWPIAARWGEFLGWCEVQRVRSLAGVQPLHVATWI